MIWIVLVTMLIFLAIGYAVTKRSRGYEDYILGGRNVPWLLLAGSLAATDIGAGVTVGVVQNAANGRGLGAAWLIWMMIPSYLIGVLFGPLLRRSEAKTIPDFFTTRYGRACGTIAALLMVIPTLGVVAVNLTVSSHVLTAITGIPTTWSLIIGTAVTIIYTYAGGMWADVITDAFQIVFIIFAMALVLVGFHFFHQPVGVMFSNQPDTLKTLWNPERQWELPALFLLYTANFLVGLSTVTRIYAARDASAVRNGILACLPVYLFYGMCLALIGLYVGAIAASTENAPLTDIDIIKTFLTKLPWWLTAGFLIAVVAAMLSTVDTLLLGAATILINDIGAPIYHKNLDDSWKVQATKRLVPVFGIAGAFLSWLAIDNVLNSLFFILSIQTCALFTPFVAGHFQKRVGAIACIITIVLTALLFITLQISMKSELSLLPFVIAIGANVILYFLLGALLPAKTAETAESDDGSESR